MIVSVSDRHSSVVVARPSGGKYQKYRVRGDRGGWGSEPPALRHPS